LKKRIQLKSKPSRIRSTRRWKTCAKHWINSLVTIRLQINCDKAERDAKEAKAELATKTKNLEKADRDFKALQELYTSLKYKSDNDEKELSLLKPEYEILKKKHEDAKASLEDETIKRVDLQNELLSKEESMKFENQMLEQQLNETRTKKQMEISELDGRLNEEYEAKLQKSLHDLRETYENQMDENKKEFVKMYDDKLKNLQDRLDAERTNMAGKNQEVRELSTKVVALTSKNSELESSNASLQRRTAELQSDMDNLAAKMREEMARKDAEVQNKEDQMNEMTKDYGDLMEIKVALDMEIAAYNKLLEGEEARLGLSPTSSPEMSPPRKRKRTLFEEEVITEMVSQLSGPGNVVIEPVVNAGKYIRVTNKSTEDVNLAGWSLSNDSNGEEKTYKFPRSVNLKPGDVCSVWSADSDEEHKPPLNLVMKKGGWNIGSENVTTLLNKEGIEEAKRESHEETRDTSLHRVGTYGRRPDDSKSCAIM